MYENKTEYELDYWRKNGVREGTEKYLTYLWHFGVAAEFLAGKTVADVGCGPLGGILSALPDSDRYGIDPLFPEYDRERLLHLPEGTNRIDALGEDSSWLSQVPQLDAVFSCNALDHSPFDQCDKSADTLSNMLAALKPGGLLFLWAHLKRDDQLDQGHDFALSLCGVLGALKRHHIISLSVPREDPVNSTKADTLILQAAKLP
jgi:SAM-dependent methyltransferase